MANKMMNTLDALTKWWPAKDTAGVASFAIMSNSNPIDLDKLASETTVSTCMDKIATTVAQLDVGKFNPGYGHTAYSFFKALVYMFLRDGCVFIVRDKKLGYGIYASASVKVKIHQTLKDRLTYEINKVVYKQEDVLHLKDIIDDTPEGGSRVHNARVPITAKIAAMKLMTANFKRGTNILQQLLTKRELTADEVKAFAKTMEESQLDGEGNFFIRLSGGAEIKPVPGLKPTDMDLRETIAVLQYEIAGMMGVPPSMIGVKTDEKYANAKQRNISFYRDTINPILTNISQGFKLKFNTDVVFDTTDLMAGDVDAQSTRANNAYNAGRLTLNEAREITGHPPVEGGDRFKPAGAQTTPEPATDPEEEDDLRGAPRSGGTDE